MLAFLHWTDVVEYLIDEILVARRSCLHEDNNSRNSETSTNVVTSNTLDVAEFLSFTYPKQVTKFNLGLSSLWPLVVENKLTENENGKKTDLTQMNPLFEKNSYTTQYVSI